MRTIIHETKQELGRAAAQDGAELIRRALAEKGHAAIIVATGASQFEVLEHLVRAPDIRWHDVTAFHLDEYVGLPITHSASFRRYLWQRFESKLPMPLRAFHYVNADAPSGPVAECERLADLIRSLQIDVAFAGIGENGHLAFNDPPADFETEAPYLVVTLDDDCRRQQMGEEWFNKIADVPTEAISMSIRQIMKSSAIICAVPDERKAHAVQRALEGEVINDVPSSVLQRHPNATLYLDSGSASRLSRTLDQGPGSIHNRSAPIDSP